MAQNIAINSSGAAAASTRMFEITQTSTAANMVALYAIHSGATGAGLTGYGLQAIKTGGAGTNIAGYFSASGSTGANYSIIIPNGGGSMGIGTLTPTAQLHIENTGADATFRVIRNAGSDFYVTSQAANSVVATAGATALDFRTSNVPGRIYIQAGGNVGIGTTTPSYLLDVAGVLRSSGTGFGGGIFLQNTTAVNGRTYSVYSNNAGQLVIGDENLGVAKFGMNSGLTGNAFITNIGNFGIGTAGPGDKLEVNGGNILVTNGSTYNGMLYSGDANWGFKIQRTAATDDYNVRMSYWPVSGTRRAGIYNANAANWVFYSDHNATPNIVMNNITSVGIGTTTPDPNAALDIEKTTNRILALFGNTNAITATDGVSQAGISIQARFAPSASTTTVADVNAYMDLAPPAGVTITDAYGLKVWGTQGGAGTVTNGYGVYVNMSPGFGTNKYAAAFLNGNVGIGTATPCTNLEVIGNIRASGWIYGNWAGSSACPSDIRFKKDIHPLENSLSGILRLQGVNYFLKANEFPDRFFNSDRQIGLIAQDVEKTFPDLVITDKDGYKAVDYTRLGPILIEAIKEQQKIIDNQKKEIESLNSRFGVMESSLKALQSQIIGTAKK